MIVTSPGRDSLNRLKSIQEDAAFVSEMTDLFPQFPILGKEESML